MSTHFIEQRKMFLDNKAFENILNIYFYSITTTWG